MTTVAGVPSWAPPATAGTVTSVDTSNSANVLTVSGGPITGSGTIAVSYSGTALPVLNGGTAVTAVPTVSAASSFAAWDVNKRIPSTGPTWTTATTSGTFNPGGGNSSFVVCTSNSAQTVGLGAGGTTIPAGYVYVILYSGTNICSVNAGGGSLITNLQPKQAGVFTCITAGGTNVADWVWYPVMYSVRNQGVASGYTTTVTSGTPKVLSVNSNYQQFFSGSTSQTVTLPVTSTLSKGHSFWVVNNSSAVVTVQSSGGNSVQAVAAGSTSIFTCVDITTTTAADWSATSTPSSLTLPVSIANGGTGQVAKQAAFDALTPCTGHVGSITFFSGNNLVPSNTNGALGIGNVGDFLVVTDVSGEKYPLWANGTDVPAVISGILDGMFAAKYLWDKLNELGGDIPNTGGSTTLTVDQATGNVTVTGSGTGTHSITVPDPSTMTPGQSYTITNRSAGPVKAFNPLGDLFGMLGAAAAGVAGAVGQLVVGAMTAGAGDVVAALSVEAQGAAKLIDLVSGIAQKIPAGYNATYNNHQDDFTAELQGAGKAVAGAVQDLVNAAGTKMDIKAPDGTIMGNVPPGGEVEVKVFKPGVSDPTTYRVWDKLGNFTKAWDADAADFALDIDKLWPNVRLEATGTSGTARVVTLPNPANLRIAQTITMINKSASPLQATLAGSLVGELQAAASGVLGAVQEMVFKVTDTGYVNLPTGYTVSTNNAASFYDFAATLGSSLTKTIPGGYTATYFNDTDNFTAQLQGAGNAVAGAVINLVNRAGTNMVVKASGGTTIATLPQNMGVALTTVDANGSDTTMFSKVYRTISAGASLAALAIALGGTGVTSVTTSPTASSWAGWDANGNMNADNFLPSSTSIVTAAGTTTLTVGSNRMQIFTGSTTQICVLPVVSTLVLGTQFLIVNESSGNVTVQSSGANSISVMIANTMVLFTCVLITGTGVASWTTSLSYIGAAAPLAIADGGTGVTTVPTSLSASVFAAWDANQKMLSLGPAFSQTNSASTSATQGNTNTGVVTWTSPSAVIVTFGSNVVRGYSFVYSYNCSDPPNATTVTIKANAGGVIAILRHNQGGVFTSVTAGGGTAVADWSWYPFTINSPNYGVLGGYTSTVTAAGTTTLHNYDPSTQFFTGTTTQSVLLPVVTTLATGFTFNVVNNSTGIVTVKSSGSNTVLAMAAGSNAQFVCTNVTANTGATPWSTVTSGSALSLPLSVANGGTGLTALPTTPTASTYAAWDSLKNFFANNLVPQFTQVASVAASYIQLANSDTQVQVITGTAVGYQVYLPNASTVPIGVSYDVINDSTQTIEVHNYPAGSTPLLACLAAGSGMKFELYDTGGPVTNAGLWTQTIMGNGTNYCTITYGGTTYTLPKSNNLDPYFYLTCPTYPTTLSCQLYNTSPRRICVDNVTDQNGGLALGSNFYIKLPDLSTVPLGTCFVVEHNGGPVSTLQLQIKTFSLGTTMVQLKGDLVYFGTCARFTAVRYDNTGTVGLGWNWEIIGGGASSGVTKDF